MLKYQRHNIFLVDAIGAFISIILLCVIYLFDDFFGMPRNVMLVFIGIAFFLFIYSATIYWLKPLNWQVYLKIVAFLNASYCLFTAFQIIRNIDTLTLYGYIYFIAEILVIFTISIYEFKNATKANC